jgi:multidrug transporter EmrE-like cation transporter
MVKYGIALTLALVLNAAANLMIRFGMRAIDIELSGSGLLDGGPWALARILLRHWVVLAGIACFALNVVFYAYALQKLPISVAYPIMVTCGFAIIVIVAGLALDERLSVVQWFGVAAILAGVLLVAKDAGRQMGSGGAHDSSAATPEPVRVQDP